MKQNNLASRQRNRMRKQMGHLFGPVKTTATTQSKVSLNHGLVNCLMFYWKLKNSGSILRPVSVSAYKVCSECKRKSELKTPLKSLAEKERRIVASNPNAKYVRHGISSARSSCSDGHSWPQVFWRARSTYRPSLPKKTHGVPFESSLPVIIIGHRMSVNDLPFGLVWCEWAHFFGFCPQFSIPTRHPCWKVYRVFSPSWLIVMYLALARAFKSWSTLVLDKTLLD
jgi:hypothetical protein